MSVELREIQYRGFILEYSTPTCYIWREGSLDPITSAEDVASAKRVVDGWLESDE